MTAWLQLVSFRESLFDRKQGRRKSLRRKKRVNDGTWTLSAERKPWTEKWHTIKTLYELGYRAWNTVSRRLSIDCIDTDRINNIVDGVLDIAKQGRLNSWTTYKKNWLLYYQSKESEIWKSWDISGWLVILTSTSAATKVIHQRRWGGGGRRRRGEGKLPLHTWKEVCRPVSFENGFFDTQHCTQHTRPPLDFSNDRRHTSSLLLALKKPPPPPGLSRSGSNLQSINNAENTASDSTLTGFACFGRHSQCTVSEE